MTASPYNETFTQFVTAAPSAATPDDADLLALIQGGVTKKIAFSGISGIFKESTVGTNQVVTAASARTAYVTSVAALNFTLPRTTSAGISKMFSFSVFAQAGAVTFIPDPSDSINGGSAGTDLIIPLGAWILFVTDADGNWYGQISNAPTPTGELPWAIATGTGDAVGAAYTPSVTSLTDGLLLSFRAIADNTSTTPTFSPDGLVPKTIKKFGTVPLAPGDLITDGEYLIRYNSTGEYWEVYNPSTSQIPWAVAGGTANVITATYAPANPALYDGLLLSFRAAAENTGAVTFAPDGLTAHAITKQGGLALVPGDLVASAEYFIRYRVSGTRWELFNPSTNVVPWAVAGGGADAITATYTPATAALTDGLLLSFRASAANATTTPTFAPDGLTAHTITKWGGQALAAGDIPGGLAECLVRYNLANTRWELLNPAGYAPGVLPVHIVTSGASYNVAATDVCIGVNKTVGSATSIVVPATGALGQYLEIADIKGDAGTNPITLSGSTFDNGSSTIVMPFNYQTVSLRWYGYWKQV